MASTSRYGIKTNHLRININLLKWHFKNTDGASTSAIYCGVESLAPQ